MSDDEDKPKKKPKPLKINGTLPNKIIKIANVDKKFHESWENGRGLCDIPHPFRMCILGKVGMGKSTLAKNILIRCQLGKYPFQELIVIHGSDDTKEWDECEPTMILNDIPEPADLTMNKKKSIIIIDDFEFQKLPKQSLKNLSSMFRFVSSHHNFSIIVCYQSFFDVPPIVKKCTNVFILYRPNDDDELKTIARRVGLKGTIMVNLFREILTEKRDTLMIDMTENTPCPYRKNLFEQIEINQNNQ